MSSIDAKRIESKRNEMKNSQHSPKIEMPFECLNSDCYQHLSV